MENRGSGGWGCRLGADGKGKSQFMLMFLSSLIIFIFCFNLQRAIFQ